MSDMARQLRILIRLMLVILVIVCTWASYVAQDVLAPVILSLLLALLLSPLVNMLERVRIPRAIGSLLVVILIVAGIGAAISSLVEPAQQWLTHAPTSIRSIEHKLRDLRAPFTKAREATKRLENLGDQSAPTAKVVVTAEPGVLDAALTSTPRALVSFATVLLLVYFFLSSGDSLLRRLVEISPTMENKRVVVGVARGVQQEISRYLVMVSTINFGLAVATALAMSLLGVPNALLWGALAGVLNFAPYVGAALTLVIFSLVGLTTFTSLPHVLAVPGVFFLMTLIEGQLITPLVIGRRLAINPVVVFVWLLVWGALWGIIGILLAGPLLASFGILCRHVPSLQSISVLMGDHRSEPAE